MSNTNTGGPAFPLAHEATHNGEKIVLVHRGMELRDYFAAKAMQVHIGRDDVWEAIAKDKITPEKICAGCYEWADAMLKARE